MMIQDKLFILTGSPGSGKTALLERLQTLGFPVVPEPARLILAEQRRIAGTGLPEKDPRLFVDLMLSRMIGEYQRLETSTAPVFLDRAVPDAAGYALQFGFDYPPGWNAIQQYRYHSRVFFAPAWEQIYTTDAERTLSFEESRRFGDVLRSVYQQSGYTLINLPCVSVSERAQFILDAL